MNVPANIRAKSFDQRLKDFISDCQRIIIAKRCEDDLERREVALRVVLALGPEIEPERFSHD